VILNEPGGFRMNTELIVRKVNDPQAARRVSEALADFLQ
jgi:hypothetical protein